MKVDWKEIIERYQEPLYWHIRRMVISHDDAKDVLQEVFLQAFRSIGQLRDPGALRPWLYRIATNKCLRFLERLSDDVSLEEMTGVLSERLHASEFVDFENVAGVRFQEALLRLSPQQKVVFSLRYYDDMSYEEISEVTGYKVDVLKSSYHQAKNRVKDYLFKEDYYG